MGRTFLLPALLVFAVIIAFPVLYSITMSFFRWRPTEAATPFVGLTNFVKVLASENFLTALFNTFLYAIGGAFFKVLIGLGLALLLN
ncbi:MAG: sugar ABC transporter permease, partial [Spirochaetota bacterium]